MLNNVGAHLLFRAQNITYEALNSVSSETVCFNPLKTLHVKYLLYYDKSSFIKQSEVRIAFYCCFAIVFSRKTNSDGPHFYFKNKMHTQHAWTIQNSQNARAVSWGGRAALSSRLQHCVVPKVWWHDVSWQLAPWVIGLKLASCSLLRPRPAILTHQKYAPTWPLLVYY